MAVDRVLAICTPFYYKRNVDVNTWKIGCLCAGVAIACFCCFPLIGLGDFMAVRGGGRVVCSSLSYRNVPVERVFGVMFGCIGFACMFTIVVCNMLVIRALIRLNNRIMSITTTSDTLTSTTDGSSDGSSAAKVTSYEVTFAKLMGALAAVYLVCGTPYNTLMLMQQFNVRIDPSITGYIHLLGGFIYTIDPIVYILVRKTSRKRIVEMLCNSCCMGEDTLKA
ncbi:uncharacterized protein LOC128238017 [Mya arenaria]|uniref:uncharacterized protein LOC128238017 n=1 Tax=Mya arenaria TaxID=6604 RepID=UPI0022E0F779|nr:uncharacterized protein LOC128238017 [Mya arenaria]